MTPEQLDEIKKLAEAAPLGEWPEDELWGGEDGFCAQGPYHACPHGGHRNARDVDACNEVLFAAAAADQAFLKKIADRTLPLIEALEEAWKERDEAREQVKVLSAYSGERHAFYQTADGKLSGLVVDKDGPWVRACDARTTERERDEARAEVERLREVVRQVHALVDGVTMIALPEAVRMLADIHKITKGEE